MRILVLDDEPFVRRMLVRQLQNLGYTDVIDHGHPHFALDSLRASSEMVGLIFCDLQMQAMDGVEFVRRLVQAGYAGALVLVSGEDEHILRAADKLARAHNLDVLGALSKPVFPQHLQKILESDLLRVAATAARIRNEPDALQHAIANGGLINHYQPKIAVATGAVVGVEALVRWQHPHDGLIFPDQFIAVAEEHDLIDSLTQVVLRSAVRQAREWRNAGIDLHVAVNVSMVNLRSVEFPDFVFRVAQEAGFPEHRVMLEVTESQAMADPLTTLDVLTRLRHKRIGLAIDDFGTGHSSLAQLRDLPFRELKIGRGFVQGACRDASIRAIFEASLRMGQQMGMEIVAEGIEEQPDWDYLRASGCDIAQGHLLARPMPGERLPDWIMGWEQRCHASLDFRS